MSVLMKGGNMGTKIFYLALFLGLLLAPVIDFGGAIELVAAILGGIGIVMIFLDKDK